jgi:hypothetical protein
MQDPQAIQLKKEYQKYVEDINALKVNKLNLLRDLRKKLDQKEIEKILSEVKRIYG